MSRDTYTLRIPKELKAKLTEFAAQTGISLNALILQSLWDLVNKKEAAA